MSIRLRWLGSLLALPLLLVGCTNSDSDPYSEFRSVTIETPAPFHGELNPEGLKVGPNVGDLAPEIDGVDLDGVAFKLSDYRGKVVMLDFYGDW